jgi:hypothetical protein
MEYAQQQQLQQ